MKKYLSLIVVGLVFSSTPIFAEGTPASTLGLAERRALKEYQDKSFVAHEAALKAATSADVTILIDWDKLAVQGQADSYNTPEYWDETIFLPLTDALKQIGRDEMGSSALKAKIKKIHVTFDPDTAPASNYANGVKFENGIITINFQPGVNSGDAESSQYKERVKAIVGALEPGL
jgi:hypothetical protein